MDPPRGPVGLIVYAGGLNERLDRIEPLLTELAKVPELAAADHYVFSSPVKRFSRGRLADRGDELAAAISNYWQTQDRPSNVLLMGHSIGGLLVRQAYLSALADPTQTWVQQVSRIVLFAAPNRGVQTRSLGLFVGRIVSLVLSVSHGWSAGDMLRGSPFLTNLRIQWLRTVPLMANPPLVIQIRGTRDTAVSKEDSIDLQAMPNSTSVEVYGADHRSIIDPMRPDEDRPGEQFTLLSYAIAGDLSLVAGLPARAQPDVSAVVFLLHGIRAGIFGWVDHLRAALVAADPRVFVQHGSYGYLSAYKFMLPWGHDRQLRKFADWYTQMLSTYGSVDFHFVGHSNGTYIFGRSLQRIPAMTFDKVYLAGSVLPRDFNWTEHANQVGHLVNACGSKDVPVGVLCSALRGVGRRDLGVGGFAGFDDAPMARAQFVTVQGGHGAGLEDPRLAGVATYVLEGTPPSVGGAADDPWATSESSGGFRFLSRAAPLLAAGLALGIVTGLVFLGLWHFWAAALGVAVIAFILLVLSVA
jgi:pimeloyl-ACP methyl ester carboxylesterase